MDKCDELISRMQEMRCQRNIDGMARYGIRTDNALGIPMPALRAEARRTGRDHALALALWDSGIHEARILASLVADPPLMTTEDTDRWTAGFDSWDVCDQCCINLYRHLPFAREKIAEYAPRPEEFVRRTAFSLVATLAVNDWTSPDEAFLPYLALVEKWSCDERNFVRKAVNWALRQVGKRSFGLNEAALETARRLAASSDRSARWIGSDAVRELTAEKTAATIRRREKQRTARKKTLPDDCTGKSA